MSLLGNCVPINTAVFRIDTYRNTDYGRFTVEYTNQQLTNFVNRIKLSQEKKSSYTNQIENLIENVRKAINEMENTKVTRIKRAGSWRKGTALAPKGENPLDIDMVFFVEVEEDTSFDAEELREEVIDVLCEAYPNKKRSDFTEVELTRFSGHVTSCV